MSELISIIISTYNDGPYLSKSIDSVLKQNYQNWELIVINDASTDNTGEIMNEYIKRDRRIKYYPNKKNKGLVNNLRQGVELSKGNYIARLDSDDIWTNNRKLEKQYLFLSKKPDYSLVGTLGYAINERGKIIFKLKYPTTDKDIRKVILSKNCFIHSSVMFNKKYYIKTGGYDSKQKDIEDYDLWLKMGTVSKFMNFDQTMIDLRIHKGSISQIYNKRQTDLALKLVQKYKHYYPNFPISNLLWQFRRLYSNLNITGINTVRYFRMK